MPPPAAAARQSGQSSPPSPAAAAAATGASARLPGPSYVLFTRWPRRFLESPCQRCEVFARRLRIRRFQLFGNWGCCGGGGAHFSVVLLCGVGFFFARSSQERAAPPGPRRSAPEPASAAGSRASRRGWRASWGEETPGWPGETGRTEFFSSTPPPRHPPLRPAPPAALALRARESPAPRTAHRVAAAFPRWSFTSPPALTFPSLDSCSYTQTDTHTHTHTPLSPPSTPAPLPRVVWK